jgi:hypothetical protein
VLALWLFLAACSGGGDGTTPPPGGPIFGPGGGGSPGWSASDLVGNLRDSSIEMSNPAVALTSSGVGFVAWSERVVGSDCSRVWVNRNAAGAWGQPIEIGIEQGIVPSVAANANGDAALVWVERGLSLANCGGTIAAGTELRASRYSASSNTWTPSVRISGNEVFSPSVVIDAAGRATVVWIQDPLGGVPSISWSRFDGGSWSAPAALSDGTRGVSQPVVAQDGSGNILVLWQQQTNLPSSGLPILPNIWFARFTAASGTWSTPVKIGSSDLIGSDSAGNARIAVNAVGNAVAVWKETRSTVASIVSARFSSGIWTPPVLIENNTQPADRPEVAIDVNGNAQAVWIQKIDGSQTNESGYTARFDVAAASWGAPQLFEQSTELVFAPVVGMDNTGRALIAWEQTNPGTGPIHAVHFTPASGFATPVHFAGTSVNLAVNGGGTALLSSVVLSIEPAPISFGISIRAAMFRP